MDSISTIVVLIFVFSIVGAVTHQKVATDRSTTSTEKTITETIPSKIETSIGHTFSEIVNIKNRIQDFIKKCNKKATSWDASLMADNIVKYSKKYNVNPKLVTAVIARESRFNQYAVSSSGAIGLGQLLPSTAKGLGVNNPYDIGENIMGTSRYIRSMLDRFKGYPDQLSFALAGYKEGPNAVKRNNGYSYSSKRYIEDILNYYESI